MKRLLVILSLIGIAGCSEATGPTYSSLTVSKPPPNVAQLVIYHPMEFVGSAPIGSAPDVKINGKTECALATGGFFVTTAPAGEVHISSTKMMSIGTSALDINTAANRRYFIRITWNGTKVLAGEIGELVTQGESYRNGPFVIELANEQAAPEELKPLKMMTDCPA